MYRFDILNFLKNQSIKEREIENEKKRGVFSVVGEEEEEDDDWDLITFVCCSTFVVRGCPRLLPHHYFQCYKLLKNSSLYIYKNDCNKRRTL